MMEIWEESLGVVGWSADAARLHRLGDACARAADGTRHDLLSMVEEIMRMRMLMKDDDGNDCNPDGNDGNGDVCDSNERNHVQI